MAVVSRPQDARAGAEVHPVAFSIHLSWNLVFQAAGVAMVSLMGLAIMPWPPVLAWAIVAVAVLGAENHFLRLVEQGGPGARWASRLAAASRIATTSVSAFAVLMLVARGGPGQRLFAFALMSATMVNVLMRYYRSPRIVATSLSPYMIVLALVGINLVRTALHAGEWLSALAPVFTIAIFAVQFWSARAQLAGAWVELMSARERAESRERAAEAANQAKSQFLSNMSHELRTPLNGVLGMAQALATDQLTQVQRERVGIIRRSSETLLSVLNDLLDLSRIETGALALEITRFDLEHLMRGVAAAYQPQAEKKGLCFDLEVAEEARGAYLGDSARIRRILYSLADNAVKFTETGGVTLRAGLEGNYVVLRVSDTGIGIGAEDCEHLFEGFFQADASLTRPYGGAGVGLAVCHELTNRMDGLIEASSTLGKGSDFTVWLPLERVQPIGKPVEAAVEEPQERPAELRVLAAEDNTTNQMVLRALLAAAGIDPTLVENGRQAVEAWEKEEWDIVLMDIQMPEMNGVEATRIIRLREQETGRARTPIIAVTANAMTHQVAEYDAAGMDGVVPKPLNNAYLFEMMDQALTLAEAGDESRAVA